MAHINEQLYAYLAALYVPVPFPEGIDLTTMVDHHLATLTGTYTKRFLEMIAAATA